MAARLRLRDASGTLRTITQLRMRDAGGTLRTITRVRLRDQNNVLRVVYDPSGASSFTATPDETLVYGFDIATATTPPVTVTAAGGTAPYDYDWTLLTYDHPTTPPTVSAVPTWDIVEFQQTNMAPGTIRVSTWRCTVTDSSTPALTATCDVAANFADIS